MSRIWWQLPGPGRFVAQIARDIQIGNNVVVGAPTNCTDHLYEAVQDANGDSGIIWHQILFKDLNNAGSPLDFLYNYFSPDTPVGELRSIQALCSMSSFAGRVIWLEHVDEHWSTWKLFLRDYQHICGAVPLIRRSLFCVLLTGQSALDSPQTEARLTRHFYRGVANDLDITLYTSGLLHSQNLSILERRLTTAVIANLSMWDIHLAEELASLPLEILFNPESMVETLITRQHWSKFMTELPVWHNGTKNFFNGGEKVHSVTLSGAGGKKELHRRIWQAQVGVLFKVYPIVKTQK